MGKALIIGAGGVAGVVIHKCCQNSEVFTEICIASRTKSKCDKFKAELQDKTSTKITTAQVDANDVNQLIALIEQEKPDIVINVALPYQDLTIMDACLATKTDYVDTANYEPEDTAKFEYKWQWAYREKFEKAGITALLGSGFDPGVTGVFCAYAQKHYFDEIHYIDILDCNGGDHGYPFATNFNPEINIREVSAKGSYIENGQWVETEPMEIKRVYNFDQVGEKDMYLLHHEELESLALNIHGIKRIRFFMTFGQSYLTHLKCLENVGMTSIEPILYEGKEIVPLQFLKAVLPDPASLGPRTVGKTNIGCICQGVKDGKPVNYYVYNVCDHQECYKEVGSQAVSYTTGVPAMIGAMMVMTGKWKKPGVYNVEEFDPDPFMEALNKWGLPWTENFDPVLVDENVPESQEKNPKIYENIEQVFDEKKAQEELEKGYKKAEKILKNREKMERLLQRLEKKLKSIPVLGEKLSYIPAMVSLIKSYIEKEYTDLPLGTIIAITSALLYFVSPIDLVPDSIPVIGYFDDAAVVAACWKLVESDVKEYLKWREDNNKVVI